MNVEIRRIENKMMTLHKKNEAEEIHLSSDEREIYSDFLASERDCKGALKFTEDAGKILEFERLDVEKWKTKN